MKARGASLLVVFCVFGVAIFANPLEGSTSLESLTSGTNMPSGSKRPRKTTCKAKKTVSADSGVSNLPIPTLTSGTTTGTISVPRSSNADESVVDSLATPAASQADPSRLMLNGTSPVAVIANTTAVDSVNSSGTATNASIAMPSSALYPVHTYKVPYAMSEGNTSYMNATITTAHGLSFLISTWSSEGTTYTSNLGVLLPEPTSSILGIPPNLTSSLNSTTSTTLTSVNQNRTTTIFLNSTRTLDVKLTMTSTTTSAVTSVASDTQTSLVSSRPARLGARYAKNLFQPKPFADLRSYLQRANRRKAHQVSEFDEKKNNPTHSPVKNAVPARLAPAMFAMAVAALAVMLVSGPSFNTTPSSTVASKSTSDGPSVFSSGLAPLHILNSIITPSLPAPSPELKVTAAKITAMSRPRRPAFGAAASPIPAEHSEATSDTVDAPPAVETTDNPAIGPKELDHFNAPGKREPKGFKPKPNACAAGGCSFATRTMPRLSLSSQLALVIGVLVMMILLPTVSASGTQSPDTISLTSTVTQSEPAAASSSGPEQLRRSDGTHDTQERDEPSAGSTLLTPAASALGTAAFTLPELGQRGACGASFPHPCSSDAVSKRALISTFAVFVAALAMLGVFFVVSK